MNTQWTCDQCTKKYKTLKEFKKHKCKRRNEDPPQKPQNPPQKPQKKPKKKKISPQIRFDVGKHT